MRVPQGLMNKRAIAATSGSVYQSDDKLHIPMEPPNHQTDEAEPFVAIPVTYIAQKHGNMCGDACVNMLYDYMGLPQPQNMNFNPRSATEGLIITPTNDIRWINWSIDAPDPHRRLAYTLLTCGPLIASGTFARFMGTGEAAWRPGHAILVTGIWGRTVLIADPWHGADRQKPIEWFLKHIEDTGGRRAVFFYFNNGGFFDAEPAPL